MPDEHDTQLPPRAMSPAAAAAVDTALAPAPRVTLLPNGPTPQVLLAQLNQYGHQRLTNNNVYVPSSLKTGYLTDDPWITPEKKEQSLIAKLMRLYYASQLGDVRTPLPHLIGPPGCGKSTSVYDLGRLVNKTVHTINVSRISPLELEGVQMPTKDNAKLKMLTATWWTQLQDGDIVLLDEFLRGFPEVYNGLLDILTARRVGNFELPKVFFIAASNSMATYDKALEDRLLHLPVADPRNSKTERQHLGKLLIEATGMLPEVNTLFQMEDLLNSEVLPMYTLLDQFAGKPTSKPPSGKSIRNLIGQVRLRQIESPTLAALIDANNIRAVQTGKFQYVVVRDGKHPPHGYEARARELLGNEKLTEIQAQNLDLNLQLIEMEAALAEIDEGEKENTDDDVFA